MAQLMCEWSADSNVLVTGFRADMTAGAMRSSPMSAEQSLKSARKAFEGIAHPVTHLWRFVEQRRLFLQFLLNGREQLEDAVARPFHLAARGEVDQRHARREETLGPAQREREPVVADVGRGADHVVSRREANIFRCRIAVKHAEVLQVRIAIAENAGQRHLVE